MSGTSDFKSQSEGGAGGGRGGSGGEDGGVEESLRPEMCNTRSTTGMVCLGSFHQANFPDKVGVEHCQSSLKGEHRGGHCNLGSLTLIDKEGVEGNTLVEGQRDSKRPNMYYRKNL